MPRTRQTRPLIVRDSDFEPDVIIHVKARDGTGARRLTAVGRRPRALTFCADHFIARGVCVDCTREAEQIIFAS